MRFVIFEKTNWIFQNAELCSFKGEKDYFVSKKDILINIRKTQSFIVINAIYIINNKSEFYYNLLKDDFYFYVLKHFSATTSCDVILNKKGEEIIIIQIITYFQNNRNFKKEETKIIDNIFKCINIIEKQILFILNKSEYKKQSKKKVFQSMLEYYFNQKNKFDKKFKKEKEEMFKNIKSVLIMK